MALLGLLEAPEDRAAGNQTSGRVTCPKRAPGPKLPEGVPIDVLQGHPAWKPWLAPMAQCILGEGHPGPHRAAHGYGLVWHDPPLIVHEQDLP